MSWLLFAGVGVSVLLLTCATLGLVLTGNWKWDARISGMAKLIWITGLSLTGGLTWIFLGTSVLMSTWPVWATLIGVGSLVFLVADLANSSGQPAKLALGAASSPSQWDAMWRSYEGKPVPPWMVQATMQGEVRYDGKVARIVNGVLVPTTSPSLLSMERLFKRLDDLLG